MEIVDFDHKNYTYIVKTISGDLFSDPVHKDMPPNKVTSELLQRERLLE